MEYGFYNPERSYWQTTGEPPNHILDGYPEGTIEVPLKPGPHHEWVNGAWVECPTPPAFATYEEASSRGRTPTEHAESIVGNADKLRSILTEVRKHWLAADTALKAVTDPYDYERVLEGARAKASPLAAQFGLKAG